MTKDNKNQAVSTEMSVKEAKTAGAEVVKVKEDHIDRNELISTTVSDLKETISQLEPTLDEKAERDALQARIDKVGQDMVKIDYLSANAQERARFKALQDIMDKIIAQRDEITHANNFALIKALNSVFRAIDPDFLSIELRNASGRPVTHKTINERAIENTKIRLALNWYDMKEKTLS